MPLRAAVATVAAASGDESVVYISLAPESVPNGSQATIHHATSVQFVAVAVVNGGFDPVAIPASFGDTLIVEVRGTLGEVIRATKVVATRRPPRVVRTNPPPKKRDVALNASIQIVFSAPIDTTTLNAESVQLWRGATQVPGSVRFTDVAHLMAEFDPDSLLADQTEYQLVLSQGIRDVNGVALSRPSPSHSPRGPAPLTATSNLPPLAFVRAGRSTGLRSTAATWFRYPMALTISIRHGPRTGSGLRSRGP